MQKDILILCSLNELSLLVRIFNFSHAKVPLAHPTQLQRLGQCLMLCQSVQKFWKDLYIIIKPVSS